MNQTDNDMLEEYDFSKGIRGKYSKRFKQGTNIIKLDPDVAEYFSDAKIINNTLRSMIPVIKKNIARIAEQKHSP